uniref:Glycosyltransferase family 92 protein n=1 Tax=Parascaris univalens TaxID=6257 RepID=A0A915BW60_PARUN
FSSRYTFTVSIMRCIRNLFLCSPTSISLYDGTVRLARIFYLRNLRMSILFTLAVIYFLFLPHILRRGARFEMIDKAPGSYYVIFSVYTYHSATRVNKRLISIAYSSTNNKFPFQCLAVNDSGWRRLAPTKSYNAELQHGLCKTMAYVAHCYLPPADAYTLLGTTGAFKLKVQPAYEKREALVVCTSPSYLFELWMTALVSIESARYFGATLRVVYIQSIISDLYKILQAYQEEGIILIKDGFDMPKLKDHPEIDSGHHNQAIAINDCLNQFKDAADFIIVADWDDIFLTGFESKLGVGALGPAYNKGLNVVDFLIDQRSKNSTTGAFLFEWMKTERSDMIV